MWLFSFFSLSQQSAIENIEISTFKLSRVLKNHQVFKPISTSPSQNPKCNGQWVWSETLLAA
jgi:hypothetical protein